MPTMDSKPSRPEGSKLAKERRLKKYGWAAIGGALGIAVGVATENFVLGIVVGIALAVSLRAARKNKSQDR